MRPDSRQGDRAWRAVRISEDGGEIRVSDVLLPFRDARVKGPYDVIPATAFWFARLGEGSSPDPVRFGCHLVVILSGELEVVPRGHEPLTLRPGEVMCVDVRTSDAFRERWHGDVWKLLVATPGWIPDDGDRGVVRSHEPRPGRPLLTWIYDDDGSSRSEPFRWPYQLSPVPDVALWPRSIGAFVTRRDYDTDSGTNGFAPGVWHNGPRPQLGVTLNGCAENETGDGTVTRPVPGDVAFIDDTTGRGHVTRGCGDRWMLFVTVAPGYLELPHEA